jgi:type IV secretory pathway VirB6-like protein
MKIFLLIFVIFFGKLAWSASLLNSSSCLIGKSTSFPNTVTVSALNNSCSQKCDAFCKSKFKLDIIPTLDSLNSNDQSAARNKFTMMQAQVKLVNQDRIEACLASCYQGKDYQGKIRVPILMDGSGQAQNDPLKPQIWACEIYPNSDVKSLLDLDCSKGTDSPPVTKDLLCSPDQIDENFIDSGINVSPGGIVTITLINPTQEKSTSLLQEDNNLYLCGFKTKFFTPKYINSINEEVTSGDLQYNQSLNTGFLVKNGDYLNINYLGRYYSSCCTFNPEDYSPLIKIGNKKISITNNERTSLDDMGIITDNPCNSCMQQPDQELCNTNYCKNYSQPINYGLYHTTFPTNTPQLFLGYFNTITPDVKSPKQFNSKYDSPQQFRSNTIKGSIKDLSDKASPLTIAYNAYSSNSRGGYFFNISWRGCKYNKGERLEYLVVNNQIVNHENFNLYMQKFAPWKSFSDNLDQNTLSKTIQITDSDVALPDLLELNTINNNQSKGAIFFRIKKFTEEESKNLSLETGAKDQVIGSYSLKLNSAENSLIFNSLLEKLLTNTILELPKNIFNLVSKNPIYINFIQALLVFYIGFMSFSFMIGMSQINQTELVIKIIKFTIVLMLLSEGSFEFFNGNFLQIFTLDTINNLANLVTPRIDVSFGIGLDSKGDCFADPAAKVKLLCIMEQDLLLGFSGPVWVRLLGMGLSGLLLPALGIIIGLFLYVFIIIKVTFMYFLGVFLIMITLSLAPFFIPFLLFKYTKGFFDGWIKQLMVLIIQPMLIFSAISLFRLIFIQLIQLLFGVNACKICLISLPIAGCIFEPYLPISMSSAGPGGSVFMISNLITLILVGYGMNKFYLYAAEISSTLINWTSKNLSHSKVGLGDLAGQTKGLSQALIKPAELLAIDPASRETRKKARDKAMEERKKGK